MKTGSVQDAHGSDVDAIDIDRRYVFEDIRIVPNTFDRNQLVLVAGTHDPKAPGVRQFVPSSSCFQSLDYPTGRHRSNTRAHAFLFPSRWWRVEAFGYATNQFVFVNDEPGMTPEGATPKAAHREADEALGAYWNALEGTMTRTKFRMQHKTH